MTRHGAMAAQRRSVAEEVGAKLVAQIKRMEQRGVVLPVAELCRRVEPPVATSTFYRKSVTVDGTTLPLKQLYEDARARMFQHGEAQADRTDAHVLARLRVEAANKDETIRRMRAQVAALQATIGERLGAEFGSEGLGSRELQPPHDWQTRLEDVRTELVARDDEARALQDRVTDLEARVREDTKTIDRLRRHLRRLGVDA